MKIRIEEIELNLKSCGIAIAWLMFNGTSKQKGKIVWVCRSIWAQPTRKIYTL